MTTSKGTPIAPLKPGATSPGPFTVHDLGAHADYPNWNQYAIRDARNVCIAVVGGVDRATESTSGADAALLASAPRLLADCREMWHELHAWFTREYEMDQDEAEMPEGARRTLAVLLYHREKVESYDIALAARVLDDAIAVAYRASREPMSFRSEEEAEAWRAGAAHVRNALAATTPERSV